MTYIIAEAGINHCGDLKKAIAMIGMAKQTGADAVKFQLYDAFDFPDAAGDLYKTLSECQIEIEEMRALAGYCREVGIDFICTPFQTKFVKPLVGMGVKEIKISSQTVLKTPEVIQECGKTTLPVIMSNGMASDQQMKYAIDLLGVTRRITILYCVSKYPTREVDVKLSEMKRLKDAFGYPVGFSDHTVGIFASVAAAAIGARIIEKHFTLSRKMPGPDQCCSLEPFEFSAMVREIRAL